MLLAVIRAISKVDEGIPRYKVSIVERWMQFGSLILAPSLTIVEFEGVNIRLDSATENESAMSLSIDCSDEKVN